MVNASIMTAPVDDPFLRPLNQAGVEVDRPNVERAFEDWLVCYLEDRDAHEPVSAFDRLDQWLERGGLQKVSGGSRQNRARAEARVWNRFRLVHFRGIALVNLSDKLLIKDELVQELAEELQALVQGGCHRLVVDFRHVEKLTSRLVGELVRLNQNLRKHVSGCLKLCGLQEELAEVFRLAGVGDAIPRLSDLKTAVEGEWPDAQGPRPLPVGLLTTLKGTLGETIQDANKPSGKRPRMPMDATSDQECTGTLRLVVESGRQRGLSIPMKWDSITVGRAAECRIRCTSSKVSRMHASLRRTEDGLLLQDLGSTNGTWLNNHRIQDDAVVLQPDDQIRIGPLALKVERIIVRETPREMDAMVVSWIEPDEAETPPTVAVETLDLETELVERGQVLAGGRLHVEEIQGVLVVSPRHHHLNEEQAEELRDFLNARRNAGGSVRIVMNCEYVRQISSRAIGVLLAHVYRTSGQSGGLRLCQVNDRLMSILERMHLPMLVDLHPRVEDAVLCEW